MKMIINAENFEDMLTLSKIADKIVRRHYNTLGAHLVFNKNSVEMTWDVRVINEELLKKAIYRAFWKVNAWNDETAWAM